jgi:eight-cysteine-cluster-containing protein
MKRFLMISLFVAACGGGSKSEPAPAEPTPNQVPAEPAAACAPTGCSNTVCAEVGSNIMTTCEYKDSYACYKTATCERQADGKCGWTETPELTACLASPPPMK